MLFFLFSVAFFLCIPGWALVIGISGQAQANGTGVVAWNREADSDPQDFEIVKVKLDENPAETSTPFTVHAAGSSSGLLTIPFNRAGIFNLVALDNKSPIATATSFGVIPPNVVVTTTSTVIASPTGVSSPSVSVIQPNPTSPTEASSAQPLLQIPQDPLDPPIIAAIVLGIILFFLLTALLVCLIRRRRRRQHLQPETDGFRRDLMVRPDGRIASWLARRSDKLDMEAAPYVSDEKSRELMPAPTIASPLSDLSSFLMPYTYGSPKEAPGRRSSRLTSFTISSSDSGRPTVFLHPQTDRQVELDNTIGELKQDLVALRRGAALSRESLAFSSSSEDHNLTAAKIKGQIERLTKLKKSDWALGFTDDVPRELYQ
ncbi:hypothetical protein C8J56DRAFT_937126 [Mycena floridula]|nr:hypothetical protein C8J56DRAFT_937126 [Mycena floridula]